MARSETVRIRRLIEAALAILSAEWPMTVRQLFYRLVSVQHVENSRGDYQKVSRIMTKARDDGRCPFKWIVDRSRPEYAPNVFDDPSEYADVIKRSYRKDYWVMQPNYCEIWTEKDAVVGSIQAVTDELGIRVRVGRGFLSTTKAHEIAERFAQIDKPIMVFYLGDHDPSGRNIEADVRERVLAHGSGPFSLKRLAIHAGDIRRFNLPPLRVKHTDSRAGEFLAKYSNACVELDALPPSELRRRIQEAVAGLLDASLWNRAIAVEQVELASIADTIARWPRGGDQLTN
jgi:hypothetical protein